MRATSGRSSSASAPRTTCSSGAPPQTCATTLLTRADENASAAVGAITSGVEDGVVTETDTAALGETDDVIVHQISASGLEGALESVDDDYSVALEALADNDDIALNFTEENPWCEPGS